MPINRTRSRQGNDGAAAQAPLAKDEGVQREASDAPEQPSRKISGYGLPCPKCHLYYSADLDQCPTCHRKERVSALTPKFPVRFTQPVAEPIADRAILEQEREESLKPRLLEEHAEAANSSESVCKFGEHHPGEPDRADVCTGCYEQLQERYDICEGALHMDLKEAAQILYDAVWADPSDPAKTYHNAASALLTELRKRAGITVGLGPFEPLTQ